MFPTEIENGGGFFFFQVRDLINNSDESEKRGFLNEKKLIITVNIKLGFDKQILKILKGFVTCVRVISR